MWVWLGVGVAGYLALMCVVVLVLRAAKARNAAERAADALDPETPWYAGPAPQELSDEDEPALQTAAVIEDETAESDDSGAADDAPESRHPGPDPIADDEGDGDGPADATTPSTPEPRSGDDADAARAKQASTRPPHPGSLHR